MKYLDQSDRSARPVRVKKNGITGPDNAAAAGGFGEKSSKKRAEQSDQRPKLIVRNAQPADTKAIAALSARVYGDAMGFPEKTIRAQITNSREIPPGSVSCQ